MQRCRLMFLVLALAVPLPHAGAQETARNHAITIDKNNYKRVACLLHILQAELKVALGLSGHASLSSLTPSDIRTIDY